MVIPISKISKHPEVQRLLGRFDKNRDRKLDKSELKKLFIDMCETKKISRDWSQCQWHAVKNSLYRAGYWFLTEEKSKPKKQRRIPKNANSLDEFERGLKEIGKIGLPSRVSWMAKVVISEEALGPEEICLRALVPGNPKSNYNRFIEVSREYPDWQVAAIKLAEYIKPETFRWISSAEGQLLALEKMPMRSFLYYLFDNDQMLWQVLARAFSETVGNKILEKVTKYIENLPKEFPSYDPSAFLWVLAGMDRLQTMVIEASRTEMKPIALMDVLSEENQLLVLSLLDFKEETLHSWPHTYRNMMKAANSANVREKIRRAYLKYRLKLQKARFPNAVVVTPPSTR